MDYFYKNCHKFHLDPIFEDDEKDVESVVEGIAMDMKPKFDINAVNNSEINTTACDDVSNGSVIVFLVIGVRLLTVPLVPVVMHYFVDPVNGDPPGLFCSFVYAFVHTVDRRCLWNSLSIFKGIVKDKPWTILGDFNVCLDPSERSCGSSKFTTAMADFRDCVEEIEVEDIAITGLRFTWNKKPGREEGLLKKLDRVLGNSSFVSSFPASFACFLPYMLSDHSPAVIAIPKIESVKARSFKFHNFLTTKDDFIPMVKRVWSNKVEGFAMFYLVSKLKLLKKPLRKLCFEQGNLFENVKKLKSDLAAVQSAMNVDPHNNSLRAEELKVLKDYKTALKDEESFLRQKSMVEWLNVGDRNSKYFHNVVKGKRNRNRFSYVEDMEGNPFHGNSVGDQFVRHFKFVLGKCSKVCPIKDPSGLFLKKLSGPDALYMVRRVSDEEIKMALFDIDGNKAPGPDGDLFLNGKLLKEVNATVISIVPKVATPCKVSYCRPLLISDNILLSQELMMNYHRSRGHAKCAFKIDIEKAYDSVKWDFLANCLRIHGLRQGDPLSSYLFTLIMEVLNLVLIREIKKNPSFRYHWHCKEVKLTHHCFADDLLLFCNGDSKSVSVMKKALAEFLGMSGLLPDYSKSTVFFGNVRDGCRSKILGIMPFKEGTLPVRYLGVPLISKRLFVKDCHVLIDKARKRILDWKNKLLSFADRLQLIKSVISSMQVYWASMFILPVFISNDIEKLMRDFLWNFWVFKRGKSLINWKSVCKMKVEGGLGIKSLDS
nr:hypothetical protein [Tanacetum cinerariifolium]